MARCTRGRSTRRARVAAALGIARHLELDVNLAAFGGSALVGDGDIPKDRALDDEREIPSTYVPARNTVFLSLALAWAEVVGAETLVIGVNALDYSGYPDCRPEYLEAFERMATLATRAGVEGRPLRIAAPLLHLSKADIIRRGIGAWPRLRPHPQLLRSRPDGRPCGAMRQLPLRASGFSEAGGRPIRLLARTTPIGDRSPLLHDAVLTEFDARSSRSTTHRWTARAWCSIAPRSIRPPAGSRSIPARSTPRGRRRRRRRRWLDPACCRRAPLERRPVLGARSTGTGASITCSSTPGSTCSRRRSTACRRADGQLSSGRGHVHDRPGAARCRAAEIAAAEAEANRVVWADRPVT